VTFQQFWQALFVYSDETKYSVIASEAVQFPFRILYRSFFALFSSAFSWRSSARPERREEELKSKPVKAEG
jgi:hypothetical protein